MTRTVGVVESVEVRFEGGKLVAPAAIGSTVLLLDVAVDFDEEGGRLSVNETTLDYLSVDHDLDAVTLATPLLEAAEEGDPVRPLDASGRPETERIVWVDLEDGDAVPAEVPTPLAPYFPEGTAITGQLVEADLVTEQATAHGVDATTRWQVVGRPAQESLFQESVRTSDEFGNVTGGVFNNGVVTATDLYYSGSFNAETANMVWDGVPASEMLGLLPKASLRWGVRTPAVSGIGSGEYEVCSLQVFIPRDCEAQLLLSGGVNASVDLTQYRTRIRHTYNATTSPPQATNASPVLTTFDGADQFIVNAVTGPPSRNSSVDIIRGTQFRAGWHDLRWTLQSDTAGSTLDTVGDFSMRVYDTGPALLANGARRSSAPGTLAAGGVDAGAAGAAQMQFYTRDYAATAGRYWSQGDELMGSGDSLGFGEDVNTTGRNRRAAVWFNTAELAADLAGATITQAQVYLYLADGGADNTVVIGTHTDPTVRGSYAAIAGKTPDRIRENRMTEGAGRWIDLPFGLQSWKSTFQGLLIGPAPTLGQQYAGTFRGATHERRPILRVTFTR